MYAARSHAELQLARARASLLSTHAQLSQGIVARLGDRMPTTRLVELYCRALDLTEFDEIWLRIQAVAHLGAGGAQRGDETTAVSRPRHVWETVVDEIRAAVAPHGDRELQERLSYEIASAQAIVMKVHMRNAVALAHALSPRVGAAAAVSRYLRELDVTEAFRGAVYALALAQLGTERRPALLPPALVAEDTEHGRLHLQPAGQP
jgi:hypothetical protein